MSALAISVLLASLAGSLHCAGMCGGLVAVASSEDKMRSFAGQTAYHLGRAFIYVLLGATAGAFGSSLNLLGRSAGLTGVAAIAAGVAMIAWALATLLPAARQWRLKRDLLRRGLLRSGAGRSRGIFTSLLQRAATLSATSRGGLLGIASAFLPCGWLYAFVLTAAGTASAASGALVMAAFWLGTVPLLLGLGLVIRRASAAVRHRLPLLSAVVVLLLGVGTLSMRYLAARPATEVNTTPGGTEPSAAHAPGVPGQNGMPLDCPLHRGAL